jgi:PAS domain S-box-containing protein
MNKLNAMGSIDKNISPELIKEERLKSTRLSVNFRWAFILLVVVLLLVQYFSGYSDISKQGITLIAVYFLVNLVLWYLIRRRQNPDYFNYLTATLDITVICYHIYNLTINFDHTAAAAAATTFLIPVIFLIYTFRLEKGLLLYLIIISVIGFNFVYYINYFQNPELFLGNISLSPLSHVFKSIYITFIGLLCIYLQQSMSKFIERQLTETIKKAELDTEIKVEQQKNKFALELIGKEKALNEKLENEIKEKDALAIRLTESREQMKSIISNLYGFTYRCIPDDNWTMVFLSDQVTWVTGYAPESFLENASMSYKSIIHPDDKEYVNDKIAAATDLKNPYELEYRIINKEGHVMWIHEAGRGVYDEVDNIKYLDGIITDISAKKQAEFELSETRDLVNTLISNLVGAVSRSLFDEHFTTLFVSEKIFDITGYRPEDFINKTINFSEIIYHEDVELANKTMADCIKKKKSYSVEFRIVHKKGHLVWVHDNGQPIYDKDGTLLYLDGITTEITEKKMAEQALIDAKRELEQLNEKLERTVEERTAKLTEANTQLLKLQKENIQSQFEVLKQQVNPHFLFNSLNVLTSLIKVDPDLAEVFTERLSKVYRYVLENKDKDLVSLGTEMEFIKAYVFLIDIRFSKKVFVKIDINEKDTEAYVAPLALQLIIENAIKHNTFSKVNPLLIELFIDDNRYLNIVNNLQSRKTQMGSTGVGLVNIIKRYSLLSDLQPIFEMTDDHFYAKIPLIDKDNRLNNN